MWVAFLVRISNAMDAFFEKWEWKKKTILFSWCWLQNFNCGCKLKSFLMFTYKNFVEHFVRKNVLEIKSNKEKNCSAWRTQALYKSLISLRIRGSDLWILSISLSYQRRIFFQFYFLFFFYLNIFVSMRIGILEYLLK